jgi:hypothetical protein
MKILLVLAILVAGSVYLSGQFIDSARFELQGTISRIERSN